MSKSLGRNILLGMIIESTCHANIYGFVIQDLTQHIHWQSCPFRKYSRLQMDQQTLTVTNSRQMK